MGLRDLGHGRFGKAKTGIILAGQRFADVHALGNPAVLLRRQSHEEIREFQRQRDPLAHELAELAAATPLDDLRDRPHAGGRVILEAGSGRPVEAPLAEAFEPPRAIVPVDRTKRRVRKAARMQEQLLHRDAVLPVGAEFGNDVRDRLPRIEIAVLHDQPAGGRCDGLGRREDAVQRIVVGVTERFEQPQAPFPGDRDLHGRQQPLVDFAAHALGEGREPLRVEPDRAWFHHGLAVRHVSSMATKVPAHNLPRSRAAGKCKREGGVGTMARLVERGPEWTHATVL